VGVRGCGWVWVGVEGSLHIRINTFVSASMHILHTCAHLSPLVPTYLTSVHKCASATVHMCARVCICVQVCAHMYTSVHTHAQLYTLVLPHLCTLVHKCGHTCAQACTSGHMCTEHTIA
jgi:cytochrome c oxidase subunit IV